MNHILIVYILIFFISVISIYKKIDFNKKSNVILWLCMGLSIAVLIHNKEYEINSDLYNYEMLATSGDDVIVDSRISEFLFWYLLKYITDVFDSFGLALIFIDAILCVVQILSMRIFVNYFLNKYEAINVGYLYFGFIIFYTQLNGLYLFRQYCAVTLFFASSAYFLENKKIKGSILLLASIFTHNSIILILPLLLSVKYFKISLIFLVTLQLFLLFIGLNHELIIRHDVNYGNSLSLMYLLIYFIALILMNFVLSRKLVGADYKVVQISKIIIVSALTYILSFMVFESNLTIERIGSLLIIFLFISIPIIIEKLKFSGNFSRLFFVIITNLPMIIFYNHVLKI